MKFVVSSTALLNVLQTSNKVVSNKNTTTSCSSSRTAC